jgi:hypothetical protein
MTMAYLLCRAALQTLGLGLLFYTIDALPMRRGLKVAGFVLITFGTLTPLLGINYSLCRFILPFSACVLLSRQKELWRGVAVAGLGEMIQFAVSPELGVAFAAATVMYGLYRSLSSGIRWFWIAVTGCGCGCIFAIVAGRDYLLTLRAFAKGGGNLIPQPLPHLLVLLVAVVALTPLAVTHFVRKRTEIGCMLLAMYAASLALLPAALGRCDPLHSFFNGLGPYLLSFVAVDRASARQRNAWVALVSCAFLFTQIVNFATYEERIRSVFRRVPDKANADFDVYNLEKVIGEQAVSAPGGIPWQLMEELTSRGQFKPGYFDRMVNVFDEQAEKRKIADMRLATFALVPSAGLLVSEPIDNTRIKRMMRFGYVYRERHTPYVAGILIERELETHWSAVKTFGSYTLFRQRS